MAWTDRARLLALGPLMVTLNLATESRPMWEEGKPPLLRQVVRRSRINPAVDCVHPKDSVGLYWRFLTHEKRLRFSLNLAARILEVFPKGRVHYPEPLDLLHELGVRYGEGIRLYQWVHWQKDRAGVQRNSTEVFYVSAAAPWLKYVFYRLVGKERLGALAGLPAKPPWTPPTVSIHGDGDDGGNDDFGPTGVAETLEFSDDSDSLDNVFRSTMPDTLVLVQAAMAACAGNGGFAPHDDKAEAVFVGLYFNAQTPAEVADKTGAPLAFVKQMANVQWLSAKLRQHCSPTIDAIVNAILFRTRH